MWWIGFVMWLVTTLLLMGPKMAKRNAYMTIAFATVGICIMWVAG